MSQVSSAVRIQFMLHTVSILWHTTYGGKSAFHQPTAEAQMTSAAADDVLLISQIYNANSNDCKTACCA